MLRRREVAASKAAENFPERIFTKKLPHFSPALLSVTDESLQF